MKFHGGFLGFLDRFSLRQLLYAWMTVVLAGFSITLVAYGWVYRNIQINSVEKDNLTAEYLLIIFTVAGLILALGSGLAVSQSITRHVRVMAEMARHLEVRDFKEYPVAIPNGELGDVTRAFLDMRRAIIGYESELRTALDQLREANHNLGQREAEALAGNRAKSAFLAAMSHEVRTPLIGINGMIEILSLGDLEQDQRRMVNIIRNSAQSLLRIIGDILDFSKIEAGKLALAPETISIPKLVEANVTNLAQTASSKGLQLHCEISDALSPAHVADPVRLNQILNNFLSNAIKFTTKGSITVRVRSLESTKDAERIIFEVQDTGIGISEENQANLFQPFAQGESNTTRRFGGTGLGLVICRHLADLMGGGITLQSAPGQGTTMAFSARFPIGDARAIVETELPDTAKLAEFIRPAPSVEEALQGRDLILLAEDHPTNREVLSRQINFAGFALESAKDGLDALDQWKSGRHALVLTDLHMPRMDGYQLTVAIRQWEQEHGLVRTPVIAITANVLQGEAEHCLEMGMDDYLTKPVSIPVLASKLRQWLPHLQGPESLPEQLAAGVPVKPSPTTLDRNALLALCGNDLTAAQELLEDFRSTTRSDIEVLDQYFEQKDHASLGRQAHRIKGASAMIGAVDLAQKAKQLEALARQGEWGHMEVALEQVREAFGSLAEAG